MKQCKPEDIATTSLNRERKIINLEFYTQRKYLLKTKAKK